MRQAPEEHQLKRLVFAESIRRRDREHKKQQIRTDLAMREQVWELLAQTEIDTYTLYNRMREEKNFEANAAITLASWLSDSLKDAGKTLRIRDRFECMHWSYFLCTVIEYTPETIELVQINYSMAVLDYCCRVGDYESIFTLLCVIVKHEAPPCSQSTEALLNEVITRRKTSLAQGQIGCCQLQFYGKMAPKYWHCMVALVEQTSFLAQLAHILEHNLENTKQIQSALTAVISITYFDKREDMHELATQNLVDCNLLDHLKFMLTIMDPSRNQKVFIRTLNCLVHVAYNIGPAQVLEHNFLAALDNLIEQPSTPKAIAVHACITYLTVVSLVDLTEAHRKIIREADVLRRIVDIVDTYAEQDEEIVRCAGEALQNLLRLGQENRDCGQAEVNVYMLALRHADPLNILARHQDISNVLQEFRE